MKTESWIATIGATIGTLVLIVGIVVSVWNNPTQETADKAVEQLQAIAAAEQTRVAATAPTPTAPPHSVLVVEPTSRPSE